MNKKSYAIFALWILISTLLSFDAFATDDEYLEIIPRESQNRNFINPLTPEETYKRTQEVLKHYKSPELPTGQDELSKMNHTQSASNIQKLLKYFDYQKTFSKLFTLTSTELIGYEDFKGKTKETLNIKVNPSPRHSENLQERIARESTPTQPLRGLRVAIDPGHMGEEWDGITGKYVKDGNGNYLSEGVMAFQTALLLQKELQSLGAKVALTRNGMVPSTSMKIEDLPVAKFAQSELLEHVYSPWFLNLLGSGTGNSLLKAFDNNVDRKKLWSESSRANYFILKEDLWSRADKINDFNPDIVLIIHYDTLPSNNLDGHGLNPKAPNKTKIFVTGAYFDVEFGSRKARKQFAKKLLDQTQWDESIRVSTKILDQFTSQMGLELTRASSNAVMVAPGIFSRNLTLPRFLDAPAIAYLECLFYNRPQEFKAFIDTKYPMYINGVNYPYSDRLKQVVNSIKVGVINYAQDRD